MMLSLSVLEDVIIIAVSLIVGLIFFYVISSLSKKEKKAQINEITSLIVNFIIYIWFGKIIINIQKFIQDPLAVLAYPSNSKAFYLACLFIVFNIWYKRKKDHLNIHLLLASFLPIFLFASFSYEFIEIVYSKNTYGWPYLSLLVCLLVIYLFVHGKTRQHTVYIFYSAWSLGQLVLSVTMPFTTTFNYMMAPWFLITVFIFFIFLYLYNKGRCPNGTNLK